MCDDRKWTLYLFSNKKGLMRPLNPLSAKFTKWSNTLKQFVGNLPTSCLSVFDHFVGLALKGLTIKIYASNFAKNTATNLYLHYLFIINLFFVDVEIVTEPIN